MSETLHPLHQRINTDLSQMQDHDTVDLVVIGSGGCLLYTSDAADD